MATESVEHARPATSSAIVLDFDKVNKAHEAFAKATAIIEMVSGQITAHMGYDGGAPYSNSLWAASDNLEELADLLGMKEGRRTP